MPRFTTQSRTVEAVRLTQRITLRRPGEPTARTGEIGDWLVTHEDGRHELVPHEQFQAIYEQPADQ